MTYDEFLLSIENDEQPPKLALYLQALWFDAKGDWAKAHALIDSLNDINSCWVHAFLHRKEADISNADYWYRKANKKRPDISLIEEWQNITSELLLKL